MSEILTASEEWVRERFGETIRYCPNCRLIRLVGSDCVCMPGADLLMSIGMERTQLVEGTPEPGSVKLYENEDQPGSYYAYYEPDEEAS